MTRWSQQCNLKKNALKFNRCKQLVKLALQVVRQSSTNIGRTITDTESALNRHTVRPFTERDDNRCCNNTICPPQDEHSTARNMLRIIM